MSATLGKNNGNKIWMYYRTSGFDVPTASIHVRASDTLILRLCNSDESGFRSDQDHKM